MKRFITALVLLLVLGSCFALASCDYALPSAESVTTTASVSASNHNHTQTQTQAETTAAGDEVYSPRY